ncbi:hypothetical protein BZG36_00447 [Bifiguratus adelaidae]|uniref:AB hydrolase-1 domain-containing protein n=1 Tax=Bifiguratus adelaidae TaxID=1938954 RepID=A0A261Y7S7_9FUNG|nr:hypothetical protein BZG36_00447 [Bifiguratus adelaidae]
MSRQLASRRFTTHTIPVHPKTHKGEQLKLVVNHYPSTTTAPHTVVCLFAHANGYTKESWIPVIERLKDAWKNRSDSALDIWTYDSRNSGDSAVVNAEWLDEKALWQDYGRDIQQMISHFGLEPSATSSLFGIGHSMGATSLLVAGISQPHSFTALIAIDPVLAKETVKQDPPIAALALKRRDRWPSRVEAKESFLKRPYYQRWDPRQVDIYAEFGLLESPNGSVMLKCPKDQEYASIRYL